MSGVVDPTLGFAIATLILLIVILCLVLAKEFRQRRASPRGQPILSRLWSALDPVAVGKTTYWSDAATRMFRLLMIATILFWSFVTIWATGASILRTVYLYNDGFLHLDRTQVLSDWTILPFAIFQIARGVGGTLAVCAAAGLVGAAFGFLFGLPRQDSDGAKAPSDDKAGTDQSKNGQKPKTNGKKPKTPETRWRLNNNLIRIVDWLTTGIVTVSLVELKPGLRFLTTQSGTIAAWLFGSRHGSYAVLPAAMAGSTVFGFIFTYLYTELIVSSLIAEVDADLGAHLPDSNAREVLTHIGNIREGLVPRISRSNKPDVTSEPEDQPTAQELEAALQFADIGFDDLASYTDVTRDEVHSWALAKAVLDNYPEAARGFRYLLGK